MILAVLWFGALDLDVESEPPLQAFTKVKTIDSSKYPAHRRLLLPSPEMSF
jgi:hypothetical protein